MAQVQTGDVVKVHYTGKLDDGTVFDTSANREPLEFKIGEGQLIPDFELAVVGMEPGESKTVNIPTDRAYGPRQDSMVITVNRSQFPEGVEPKIDQKLQVRHPDGQNFVATIIALTETEATLDANHPLAGKDLTFDIQLAEIVA